MLKRSPQKIVLSDREESFEDGDTPPLSPRDYPDPKIELLIDDNCPCDFESVRQDICDDVDFWKKIDDGTLTEEEIDDMRDWITTSFECGAVLNIEITKIPINKDLLSKESSYFRTGWDKDDFGRYGDDAEKRYWGDEEYGYALYKIGAYYVLLAGFPG